MTREELVRGLRECGRPEISCEKCPYYTRNGLCFNDIKLDAAEMLEQDTPRWISVKDRLPEYGRYLVTVEKDDDMPAVVHTAVYDYLGWWTHSNIGIVTNWMPLPELPEEETK